MSCWQTDDGSNHVTYADVPPRMACFVGLLNPGVAPCLTQMSRSPGNHRGGGKLRVTMSAFKQMAQSLPLGQRLERTAQGPGQAVRMEDTSPEPSPMNRNTPQVGKPSGLRFDPIFDLENGVRCIVHMDNIEDWRFRVCSSMESQPGALAASHTPAQTSRLEFESAASDASQ